MRQLNKYLMTRADSCIVELIRFQEKSSGRSAHYKLTSTAMLWLQTNKEGSGTMNLGGSLTRQVHHLVIHKVVSHLSVL